MNKRPGTGGRKRIHENNAARVRAHREKHKLHSFTVELPYDLYKGLEEYLKFRDESKSAVIARLIKNQLLRKR
ncbi:hypothetical protein SKTS_21840 [Sulfurimicrobium lacus]|uniref:LexA regulated protein n=1 Tax=Sulfurimicrobium lacus TaxID=2715678 RepID=A0A6F8VC50_9PROT|nr:hypothetical protein [Sulfurimicrobium lacus]BCB27298.1 hypothetical protein SKTS_21840 [Sulfurimicrobium lacus]